MTPVGLCIEQAIPGPRTSVVEIVEEFTQQHELREAAVLIRENDHLLCRRDRIPRNDEAASFERRVVHLLSCVRDIAPVACKVTLEAFQDVGPTCAGKHDNAFRHEYAAVM